VLVTQITNKILERGKRTIAERIVYGGPRDRETETR
jgi:ribosomal protein S7